MLVAALSPLIWNGHERAHTCQYFDCWITSSRARARGSPSPHPPPILHRFPPPLSPTDTTLSSRINCNLNDVHVQLPMPHNSATAHFVSPNAHVVYACAPSMHASSYTYEYEYEFRRSPGTICWQTLNARDRSVTKKIWKHKSKWLIDAFIQTTT